MSERPPMFKQPNDYRPFPSYKKAMMQVVAYRRIRGVIAAVLRRFELSTTQWMILSVLYESTTGLRITDIAHSVEVEVPLITRLSRTLKAAGLIENKAGLKDKRAKPLGLTVQGQAMITRVERELAQRTVRIEAGVSSRELDTYFKTLGTIMNNASPRP
jgi:DNA-binding MarR family transcriptional regulator